ncbi:MAG: hypothetical protein M5U26_03900 [Planctomycetota bacterium]|nr:hypothetical protein [Planctomycetota bacterium]
MDRLIFEPVVPEPLLAALWTLAALFAAGYAFWRPVRLALWRRLVLAALHFVPLAGVLILLHRPTWVRIAGRDGGKPALTVLVDQSGSMDTEDVPGHASRYAAARGSALRHFSAWGRTFEVRVRGFDKALTPALHPGNLPERSPQGNLTDLAGALEGVLQDQPPPSALLVLSDGIHNAPGGDLALVARAARAAGAPVFTVALGSDVSVRDLGLTLSASEELTFIKQRVRVPVIVTQTGLDDTEQAVELLFGGQVVERKTIRFEAGAQVAETSFEVAREEAGLYAYEVRVPGVQGEALAGNNRRRFALRVVDERIRVLFLEGKPYWDGKFLARALREDPNVVLTTAVRMRENRMLLEPPQPRPEEEQAGRQQPWFAPADEVRPLEDRRFLGQFQVLILGRETDDFLTERGVENLRDWISRSGGQLVCARGRPAAGSSLPRPRPHPPRRLGPRPRAEVPRRTH